MKRSAFKEVSRVGLWAIFFARQGPLKLRFAVAERRFTFSASAWPGRRDAAAGSHFAGRVHFALGGAMTYNFALGKIPVSTSARVYREFDAENRLQGTAGWPTMAIPLP